MKASASAGAEGRTRLALLAITLLALGLRVAAAFILSPHTDEPASQLASLRVAQSGAPVFHSGVLYLQGATMSYLLAPLAWLGIDTPWQLEKLRLVTATLNTLGVVLLYRLVRETTGRPGAGLVAALLLALDPLSVTWGANIRPYGLLETLCVLVVLLTWRALHGSWGAAVGLALAFVAVTFTHVGGLMLWPGLVLAALAVHQRRVLTEGRPVVAGLLGGLAGPAALLLVNSSFGVTSTRKAGMPAFVGNHLLDLEGMFTPSFKGLDRLYHPLSMGWVQWVVFTIAVGIAVVAATELARKRADAGILLLLAGYAAPLLAVVFLLSDQQARYLLPIQPFGFALVAAAPGLLPRGEYRRILDVAAFVVAGGLLWGTVERLEDPLVDEDFRPTLAWLVEHRQPEEPVLAVLPPIFELMLGRDVPAFFMAGSKARRNKYTRYVKAGNIDYWTGWRTLGETDLVCRFANEHPEAWVPIDRERLALSSVLGPRLRALLHEGTEIVYDEPGAALVLRFKPLEDWGPRAMDACVEALLPPRLPFERVSPVEAISYEDADGGTDPVPLGDDGEPGEASPFGDDDPDDPLSPPDDDGGDAAEH